MSKRLPGSQIRCVITRAPRELIFCVRTGSVTNGWSKPHNCTGSTADIRASNRKSRIGGLSFDDAGSGGIEDCAPWNAVLRFLRTGASLSLNIINSRGQQSRKPCNIGAGDSLSTLNIEPKT